MWRTTLLLLSLLLSFTSADNQRLYVEHGNGYQLSASGNALTPAVSDDSNDDFQASHAVHLKTSNGVKIKLLVSVPPDMQPGSDGNHDSDESATIPLPPSDPSAPIENKPTPDVSEVPSEDGPSAPELPVEEVPSVPELPEAAELPVELPPFTPNVPSIPSTGGSSNVIPIVFRTINGVQVKLHVNIPPEFQHIIEAHESITVPGSSLPIPQPIIPKPDPVEDEAQSPTVPIPEDLENLPEEPVNSNPDSPEDESQTPTVPIPEDSEIQPEEPVNSSPEDEPQRPIVPRPEPISIPSVPEDNHIGLKPIVLEAPNGIKVKLFVHVPPHLASLIDINQSIEGPPSALVPTIPDVNPSKPINENPSAPDVETEVEFPANAEPEVPANPEAEVPTNPEPEVPVTPELEDPSLPEHEVPGQPEVPSDPQLPENSLPQTPGTGGIIKVPDPADLLPQDPSIKFATDTGIQLHVKVNSPARVRHLVQQQSEVTFVNK